MPSAAPADRPGPFAGRCSRRPATRAWPRCGASGPAARPTPAGRPSWMSSLPTATRRTPPTVSCRWRTVPMSPSPAGTATWCVRRTWRWLRARRRPLGCDRRRARCVRRPPAAAASTWHRGRTPRHDGVDWAGWAIFGLIATSALTAVLIGAQLSGLTRLDLPLMLGTLLMADPDRARVAGFFVHLLNGQIFALGYAAVFAAVGASSWWAGGLLGVLHGAVALLVIVPLLPGVHPRMASERAGLSSGAALEPPGLLGLNYGRQTPVVTMLAHVAYGVALGLLLDPS